MRISHIISSQSFMGLTDQSPTTIPKTSSVVDYDSVVEFIKKHKEQEAKNAQYRVATARNSSRQRNKKFNIFNPSIKKLTLSSLKSLKDEFPMQQVVNFHTNAVGKENTLPFIYIYRLKGRLFSINSYIEELINSMKDYPNEIAKILVARDPKTKVMPSMFLSKYVWQDLFNNILGNADEKYLTEIQTELIKHKNFSKKQIEEIVPQKEKKPKIQPKEQTQLQTQTQEQPQHKAQTQTQSEFPKKNIDSLPKIPKEIIIDNGAENLIELSDYIARQEKIGNILWYQTRYKNHINPMIFTLFDSINSEQDSSVAQSLIERLKQNHVIDYSITDINGSTLFEKALKLQNKDLIEIMADKKINYKPSYDSIAKEIKDESIIKKLKECDINFEYINEAAKRKSFQKLDKIFSELNSIFYSREKSGLYVLRSILSTKDDEYMLDFWKKYSNFIPFKSGSIISKFIMKIKV